MKEKKLLHFHKLQLYSSTGWNWKKWVFWHESKIALTKELIRYQIY